VRRMIAACQATVNVGRMLPAMREQTTSANAVVAWSERQRTVQHLIELASKMADRSHRKNAQHVMEFVRSNGVLAGPLFDHGLGYERVLVKNEFYIVAVKSIDSLTRSSNKDIQYFSQSAQYGAWTAVYYGSDRLLYLPIDWPISYFAKAMLILHEGFHAMDDIVRGNGTLPPWKGEVKARRLECSVLLGCYGRRLRSVFKALIPELKGATASGDPSDFDFPPSIDSRLASLFGVPVSSFDKWEQRAQLRRVAVSWYLRHTQATPDLWQASVRSEGLSKARSPATDLGIEERRLPPAAARESPCLWARGVSGWLN
jgi:hypothetical protein